MLTATYATLGLFLGISYLVGVKQFRDFDWIDLFILAAWIFLWPFMFVAEVGNTVGDMLKQYEGE